MSESDSSNTWSESDLSYYSTESSISAPWLCRYAQRFTDLIINQFRRMPCFMRLAPAEEIMADDTVVYSGSTLRPKQLASILRTRLEQLSDEIAGGEEQLSIQKPVKKAVTIQDFEQPSCSNVRQLPYHTYLMKSEQSGVGKLPTSSTAETLCPYTEDEEKMYVKMYTKMLNEKKPTIVRLPVDLETKGNSLPDHGIEIKDQQEDANDLTQDSRCITIDGAVGYSCRCASKDVSGKAILEDRRPTVEYGEEVFEKDEDVIPPEPFEVICVSPEKKKYTSQHSMDVFWREDKLNTRGHSVKWTDSTKKNDGNKTKDRFGKKKTRRQTN